MRFDTEVDLNQTRRLRLLFPISQHLLSLRRLVGSSVMVNKQAASSFLIV
jgi:hypothetical protein